MSTVIPLFRMPNASANPAKGRAKLGLRETSRDPTMEARMEQESSLEWWRQVLLENLDSFAQVLQEGRSLLVEGVRPKDEAAVTAQRDLKIFSVEPLLITERLGGLLS